MVSSVASQAAVIPAGRARPLPAGPSRFFRRDAGSTVRVTYPAASRRSVIVLMLAEVTPNSGTSTACETAPSRPIASIIRA